MDDFERKTMQALLDRRDELQKENTRLTHINADLLAACEDLIEVIGYAGLWPMFAKQIDALAAALAKAKAAKGE